MELTISIKRIHFQHMIKMNVEVVMILVYLDPSSSTNLNKVKEILLHNSRNILMNTNPEYNKCHTRATLRVCGLYLRI